MSLAEIESEDFPGERLICCRNPLVAAERASKREDMLRATERALSGIERRVEQGTLSGRDQIGLAAGAVWNRFRIKSSAGSRRAVRAVLCAAERFMRGA